MAFAIGSRDDQAATCAAFYTRMAGARNARPMAEHFSGRSAKLSARWRMATKTLDQAIYT
jgi:hypothetical protein